MAHELTQRADGFTETAFVGDTPWHRLGQRLERDASMQEWREAAGMNWEIHSAPVMFTPPQGEAIEYAGQNVLYRSDNLDALSVVTDQYKPVQPREVLEFFANLVADHGFRLHTAGTLSGGRRLWALAETGKYGEVVKDDGVGGFLLLSTSCDKTLSTTARFTKIRVVCNNTLTAALGKNDHTVSLTHRSKFDYQKVQKKLGVAVESFGAFLESARVLQQHQLNVAAAEGFVKRLVESQVLLPDGADVTQNRAYQKILSLFDGGAKGAQMVGQTRWGMLNAVTEYIDHHSPNRTDDARLNSAWFGNGERWKNTAADLLISTL